jgi:hypothetical protein
MVESIEEGPWGDTNSEWYPSPWEMTMLVILLSIAATIGVGIGIFLVVWGAG